MMTHKVIQTNNSLILRTLSMKHNLSNFNQSLDKLNNNQQNIFLKSLWCGIMCLYTNVTIEAQTANISSL